MGGGGGGSRAVAGEASPEHPLHLDETLAGLGLPKLFW